VKTSGDLRRLTYKKINFGRFGKNRLELILDGFAQTVQNSFLTVLPKPLIPDARFQTVSNYPK
jgi:hypothetical protein